MEFFTTGPEGRCPRLVAVRTVGPVAARWATMATGPFVHPDLPPLVVGALEMPQYLVEMSRVHVHERIHVLQEDTAEVKYGRCWDSKPRSQFYLFGFTCSNYAFFGENGYRSYKKLDLAASFYPNQHFHYLRFFYQINEASH